MMYHYHNKIPLQLKLYLHVWVLQIQMFCNTRDLYIAQQKVQLQTTE